MADALERLKNRNRPVVSNRNISQISSPVSLDKSASRAVEHPISVDSNIQQSHSQRGKQVLQTKQSTLRLEIGISDRLQKLCQDNKICREVLIEAMFEYCETRSEALQVVLNEAKIKNKNRQQHANQKRAKSMMRRFESDQ